MDLTNPPPSAAATDSINAQTSSPVGMESGSEVQAWTACSIRACMASRLSRVWRVSSTVLTLVVIPALYSLIKQRQLARKRPTPAALPADVS